MGRNPVGRFVQECRLHAHREYCSGSRWLLRDQGVDLRQLTSRRYVLSLERLRDNIFQPSPTVRQASSTHGPASLCSLRTLGVKSDRRETKNNVIYVPGHKDGLQLTQAFAQHEKRRRGRVQSPSQPQESRDAHSESTRSNSAGSSRKGMWLESSKTTSSAPRVRSTMNDPAAGSVIFESAPKATSVGAVIVPRPSRLDEQRERIARVAMGSCCRES